MVQMMDMGTNETINFDLRLRVVGSCLQEINFWSWYSSISRKMSACIVLSQDETIDASKKTCTIYLSNI